MSMFEDERYRWRETYFIQFDKKNRPLLAEVERRLAVLGEEIELASPIANDEGRIESLTILAPEDFAALDISYIEGDEVLEQGEQFAAELTASGCQEENEPKLDLLRSYAGRFDVLHFEHVDSTDSREENEEMLDPSALLLVLDVLTDITDGITVDPQGGTIM